MLKRIFLVILFLNFFGIAYAQSSDEPVIYLTPESHTADNSDDVDIDDDLVDNDNAGANALKPVTPPPAEKPKPKFYGPITKQDHIYALAKKFHFDTHVTTQQIMIALLHQNPQAFANNNVNELIPGSMLTVPTLAQIELIPADLAKALVLEQDHQWQKVQAAELEKINQAKFLASQIAKQKLAEKTAEEKAAKEFKAAEKAKAAMNNNNKKILQPIPPQYSVQAANLSEQYNQEINSLQKKLTQNEEKFNQYQVTMQQRLNNIQQNNVPRTVSLPPENKIIPVIKKPDLTTIEPKKHTSISYLLPNNKVSWWILWAAAFLIVLIWVPSKKKSPTVERQEPIVSLKNAVDEEKNANENKDEDEYDFMNSQEAMPAKLDLARAYIDMEDYASAKMLLEEILNKGSEAERKEAKKLLRSIKTRV